MKGEWRMTPAFSASTFRSVLFPEPFPPYRIVIGDRSIVWSSFAGNSLKGYGDRPRFSFCRSRKANSVPSEGSVSCVR